MRGSLFGRERELDALEERLETGARLISLVGPGGVGKSRLAQAWVARARAAFEGGAVVCDLGPVTDGPQLRRCVLDALGENAPDAHVIGALERRAPTLIVLDNCEHLSTARAIPIEAWLEPPHAHCFVATTQVAFRVANESVLRIDPLEEEPAVSMIAARIHDADPDAAPDRQVLTRLVARLDGLPLALELAAARASILDPRAILERLDDRFALLSSRRVDRPARHSTLAATIDWSFALLNEEERQAMACCATFAGPFSLELAERILPSDRGLDLVQSLVERSLIARSASGTAARFRLLESIREFSRAELPNQDARLYSVLTQRYAPDRATTLDQVNAEAPHLERMRLHGTPAQRALATLALAPLHEATTSSEGRLAVLQQGLEGAEGHVRTRLHIEMARAHAVGDADAAYRALDSVSQEHASFVVIERHRAAAYVQRHQGRLEEATSALESAAEQATGLARARVVKELAVVQMLAANTEAARRSYETAARAFEEANDTRSLAEVRAHLGALELDLDDARAQAFLDQAHAAHVAAGHRRRAAVTLSNLAVLAHQMGELDLAERRWMDSLAEHRSVGNRRFEAFAAAGLAAVLHERGEFDDAEQLLNSACSAFESMNDPRWEGWARSRRAALWRAQGKDPRAAEEFVNARRLLQDSAGQAWLPAVAVLCGESTAGRSSAERIARRLVAANRRPETVASGCLVFAEDGAWFQLGARTQDLSRRHALRRVFCALAQARLVEPGSALSTECLVGLGWPGERMTPASGRARVYTAVRTLRRMGLEGLLVRVQAGYTISESVPVESRPAGTDARSR